MSKWVELSLIAALMVTPALADPLGLGRTALPEEIAAWDLTILPDGTNLPVGSGDVETGDQVFGEKCASCHGDFAEGIDNWPVLAGGEGSLRDRRPVKTIGSYWPHLSTAFDYVHRSMPFGNAQTLSVDDTYAIVAFLLYSNGLVEDDFTLSNENFTSIKMPNAEGFYPDDRKTAEYPAFSQPACMTDCAEKVEITKRAVKLGVTPMENGLPAGTLPNLHLALASQKPEGEAAIQATTEAAPVAGVEPALVDAGAKIFKKCMACHKIGEGARNAVGPELNGIVGRAVASVDDFKYSPAMTGFGKGKHWDSDLLKAFLANPKAEVKGTKMTFAGLKKPGDIDAVIAYLSTFKAD